MEETTMGGGMVLRVGTDPRARTLVLEFSFYHEDKLAGQHTEILTPDEARGIAEAIQEAPSKL